MAATVNKVHLQFHKARKQYAKVIGKALGEDGTVKKKLWYLGDDYESALHRYLELRSRWKALERDGKHLWDEEADYQKERATVAATAKQSVPATVGEAIKLYCDGLKRRYESGQCSRKHYTCQQERLRRATLTLNDLPIAALGEKQITDAVLTLCARPIVRHGGTETKGGQHNRMSDSYAKSCCSSLKWFLRWCAESDSFDWTPPRRFNTIFKARPVLTLEEQERQLSGNAAEVNHFTLEELVKLWQYASDFQRGLILLALNCGFANAEAATLTLLEVKGIAEGSPYIERYRRKTIKTARKGAYAKWHLWNETWDYLAANISPMNDGKLWLMTDEGVELTAHDAIGQGWRRLVARAGVRPLSFKFLRKTAAYLVRCTLGYGDEVADMLLSHADGGMIRHYSGRDWDGKLKEALIRLREYLAPMFSPVTPEAAQEKAA